MNWPAKNKTPQEKALDILEELKIKNAPVDVDFIASQRGIVVHYIPLEEKLSGMIFRQNATIIIINSLHHPNRQRFTLAHELGHFVMHMQDLGSEVHVDKKFQAHARNEISSQGWDIKEIQANQFAAELLVPHPFLKLELQNTVIHIDDEENILKLARIFRVSSQMMTFRISAFYNFN